MLTLRVVLVSFSVVIGAMAQAQVQCTMPNGVVIEQKLSNVCPAGARKAQAVDGSAAPIRWQVPAAPVTMDKRFVKRQVVTRAEFGADWPLTVDGGTLRCKFPDSERPQMHALLIEVGSDSYALNGVARTHAARNGWRDVRAVWRDNPQIPGTKVAVTPLIERAEALCR